jgi:predicted TIM-barrel fold metal-dependent hydrolase
MLVLDAHAYVGDSLFGLGRNIEALLSTMDRLGIDAAVLCPNRPQGYRLQPANEFVARAVAEHPTRFYGFARVDPWQGEAALEDLRRSRQELGLHGLLLHPWEEQFQVSSALVDPLVEFAVSERMPVMVETGYPLVSHPLDVAELASRHPTATFVATHGLQLDSSAFALADAEVAMRECDNLLMETSGMYAPGLMEMVVRDLGAERLVFGSHSPWLDAELELHRVMRLGLTAAQKEAVLGTNIQRLLGSE